ncbi:unnamed protein product [Rotaria sp. Silwood2]|nr:unnamed protein product [Rotaria sp. Silwood2]CAF2868749.1 unnamed protein product [Rotaria sp. Silwood2]CAF2967770.1 unnamed protein product [Rotaria sp. Silwood2]CAF3419449.1 unnamed protein product [Rotaria sp. Silwood2]CAF4082165.1 unnamed protein product [Rotaria sp. Silwood2]
MWGGGFNPYGGSEMRSDMWIQQNVPGGLNSGMGEYLDNRMGGNPNPTWGQAYGGYPGVGGYGAGYGYSYGGY